MRFISTLICITFLSALSAQSTYIPLGNPAYPLYDRFEIKYNGDSPIHSALKGYNRGDLAQYALHLATDSSTARQLSPRDREALQWIFSDNNESLGAAETPTTIGGRRAGRFEKVKGDTLYRFIPDPGQIEQSRLSEYYQRSKKPILGLFYRTPANLLEINRPAFHLRVNPLINFKVMAQSGDREEALFLNQRGIEIRGGFDDRIYFYSNVTDSQGRFPGYVQSYVGEFKALPGNGYYKAYNSRVFNSAGSYDWLNGQAHIGFNLTPHVGLQFGHGKNFIGDGYRSLFLSDFSQNYLYLKANWRVWRFHYQNLFAQLQTNSAQANTGDNYLGRKYMAAHYLSFDLAKNFSIGLFEATVFQRGAMSDRFELQYLNPVILYRVVEHLLDSEDNVLAGLSFKWNFLRRFRLYGQLLLDEYKFNELTSNKGWWANKWGVQAGLQYIDVLGIDCLDFRAEYNTVRPYTYSHKDSLGASYSHYNQSLAHPLGANFKELLFTLRYQPFQKWLIEARLIRAQFGEDEAGKNWGGNILLTYRNRVQPYGNYIGQGVLANATLLALDLSYEIRHQVFIDLHYFHRKKESEQPDRNQLNSYLGGGIRMNMSQLKMDF